MPGNIDCFIGLDVGTREISQERLNNTNSDTSTIIGILYDLLTTPTKTRLDLQGRVVPAHGAVVINFSDVSDRFEVQVQNMTDDVFAYVVGRNGGSGALSAANTFRASEFVPTNEETLPPPPPPPPPPEP